MGMNGGAMNGGGLGKNGIGQKNIKMGARDENAGDKDKKTSGCCN